MGLTRPHAAARAGMRCQLLPACKLCAKQTNTLHTMSSPAAARVCHGHFVAGFEAQLALWSLLAGGSRPAVEWRGGVSAHAAAGKLPHGVLHAAACAEGSCGRSRRT